MISKSINILIINLAFKEYNYLIGFSSSFSSSSWPLRINFVKKYFVFSKHKVFAAFAVVKFFRKCDKTYCVEHEELNKDLRVIFLLFRLDNEARSQPVHSISKVKKFHLIILLNLGGNTNIAQLCKQKLKLTTSKNVKIKIKTGTTNMGYVI